MIAIFSRLWGFIPAWGQFAAVAGAVAFVSLFLWRVHHNIDKGGYDRAMAEIKAATEQRQAEARVEIIKTEKKYAKIRKNMQSAPGRSDPVSPLVGLALDSLSNRP